MSNISVFVHIPEEEKKWENAYLNYLRNFYTKIIKRWQNSDESEFEPEVYEKEGSEYWRNITQEQINTLIQEGYSMETINDEIKYANLKTNTERKQALIDGEIRKLEIVNNSNSIREIILVKSDFFEFAFHHVPFTILNNKLYINVEKSYEFDEYKDLWVIEPITDKLFKQLDPTIGQCDSAISCINKFKEHNIELGEKTINKLTEWFNKYPDTIIMF